MSPVAMTPAQAERFLAAARALRRRPFRSMTQVKPRTSRPTWHQLQLRCGLLSIIQAERLFRRHAKPQEN